jgi:hypothetical protein
MSERIQRRAAQRRDAAQEREARARERAERSRDRGDERAGRVHDQTAFCHAKAADAAETARIADARVEGERLARRKRG